MRLRGKISSRRVILGAALGLTLALRTYAWACSPAVSVEQFDLSVLSVTVDGVEQTDLSAYKQVKYQVYQPLEGGVDVALKWSDSVLRISKDEYYVFAK